MRLILPILLLLAIALATAGLVSAAPTCTASVSPATVYTNSNDTYTFSLTNSSSEAIAWIRITIPSPVYWSITSLTNPTGWTGSTTNDDATLTGGTLAASGSLSISLVAGVGDDTTDAVAWTVQVSGSSDGSSPVTCTGSSLGTSIISLTTAPAISNVAISDITDSEAKFTWTTNVAANSVINYGATNSYGSTKSSSTLTTSHSVTLTGLSTNTTYHYQIQSTATGSSAGQTSDSTFSTSKQQSTTVTITTADTTAPAISLSFDTSQPFSTPPTVSGTATDNIGVTIVEYSLTGGNIYTKAALTKSGAQSTAFDFTIPKLADGSYTLKIRSRDAAANTGNYKDIKITLDSAGPAVNLTTDLSRPFSSSPLITGAAADISGVSSVSYSIDGENFLPVDSLSSNGKFEFTPIVPDDGTYPLSIKASDSVGNWSLNLGSWILIIDRLPPQVGAQLITFGPLTLSPGPDGNITVLPQLDLKFTLSAVGGPSSIDIVASESASYALSRNPASGLWSTTLSFSQPGFFTLTAASTDSAGNHTQKTLTSFNVLPQGQIYSHSDSSLTVYQLHPSLQIYQLWNAAPFAQKNPLYLDSSGAYSLLLPPGTYFLEAKSTGYITQKTNIFTLTRTTPVTANFRLQKSRFINLGFVQIPWPFPRSQLISYSLSTRQSSDRSEGGLINQPFPPFSLGNFSHTSLKGQPALITFLNSWSPVTSLQLVRFSQLPASPGHRLLVIFPQESSSAVASYLARGRYSVPGVADPDGLLVTPTHLTSTPTHFFLDRRGVIKKTAIGLLTTDEILDNLIP